MLQHAASVVLKVRCHGAGDVGDGICQGTEILGRRVFAEGARWRGLWC